MAVPRVYHTATLLPDGSVLVCGGYGGGRILDSAERYDPSAEQFRPAGRMMAARDYAAAAPLPGERSRHRRPVERPDGKQRRGV